MSEHVFVEEYRKELAETGFPFVKRVPVSTETGYTLPIGTIIDASVYYDTPAKIPKLTVLEKSNHLMMFIVGEYAGTLDLRQPTEVIELKTADDLFGGILVVDLKKINILQSWRNGRHPVSSAVSFCPRCLEYLPVGGVQRFRADSGELFSGNVVIVSGVGGAFSAKVAAAGFPYLRVDYFGDPTWQIRNGDSEYTRPIQSIVCVNSEGEEFPLTPGLKQEMMLVSCNTRESHLHDEALRIGSVGSRVLFSLGGL